MRNKEMVEAVLEFYPRIFHACHSRHVRDPGTREAVSTNQTRVLDHLDDVEPTSLMGLAPAHGRERIDYVIDRRSAGAAGLRYALARHHGPKGGKPPAYRRRS